MTHPVKDLTRITSEAWGCLGCGKPWSVMEMERNVCAGCFGRVSAKVKTHYYVDKFETRVPTCAIDFEKETK